MRGKIFTPDEANRMLPLVSRIADDVVDTYAEVNRALQAFEAAKARAEDDATQEIEVRRADGRVAELLDRFQALIAEVEALGATVKDYESGGIDFYGEVDGEIVYLCWRRGDDSINFWHRLEDGYSKRQPLPEPSTLAG
jgi:hypothetical protein